jgi:DNA-directed RNA polymerase subunit L
MQQDWYNLESERIFIEDSFDFAIRTIGVFANGELVQKACNILINHLEDIAELARERKLPVEKSISTLPNSFDITLVNEDYSVGKVIEFALHQNEYKKKTLSYVGFRKNHPHDTDSIIRAALKSESEDPKSIVYNMVQKACSYAVGILNEVATEFQDNSSN